MIRPVTMRYRIQIVCLLILSAYGFAGNPSPVQPDRPRTIRSAAEVGYPPFSMVNEQGKATGFSVELMEAALAAMGRHVAFRTGVWTDVKSMLEKGRLDALPLVGRTPEREAVFDFTVPYMTLHGAIVVRKDSTGIHTLTDLRGRNVAVMEGDNAEEFLRREDRGLRIHTTDTFETALRELSAGKHDAVFCQRLVALRLIRATGLNNLKVLSLPVTEFQQDFCFAVTEGDRGTLALLNEGLATVIADGTYRRLHIKWFAALELPTPGRVIVGGDFNYPPYEYLEENGRPTGYNVELVRAISDEMGLDVEFRLTPWPRTLRNLETGETDLVQGMFYSPERDRKFDFSPPHAVNHYVAVTREGAIQSPETVVELAGLTVSVEELDIAHDFLMEQNPGCTVLTFQTQEAAIRAVVEGKTDCALVGRLTALYWMEKHGWSGLRTGRKSLLSPEYCFAAVEGRKAILAQFTEGLKLLERSGEYRRIQDKWMGVYPSLETDLGPFLRHAAILIVTLLVILLWSRSLRRRVRKRTKELAASEEKYRLLAEHAADVIWVYDLRKESYRFVSPAVEAMFGYTPEEALGQSMDINMPPEAKKTLETAVDRAIRSNRPGPSRSPVELEQRRKDGTPVWTEISFSVIRDRNGGPERIIGITRDITERKHLEDQIAERETRYRNMFARNPQPMWIYDLETLQFLEVNEAAVQHYGYSREEFLSMTLKDIRPSDDVDLLVKDVKGTGATLSKAGGEWRHRKKNGEIINVTIVSYAITFQGRTARHVMVTDITEQKKTEAELERARERLALAVESAGIGLWEYDGRTGTVVRNREWYTMLGYEPDELDNRVDVFRDLIHPEDRHLVETALSRHKQNADGSFSIDRRLRCRDGGYRWVRSIGRIVEVDDQGNTLRAAGVHLDISKQKSDEQARTELQDQLLQAQKMDSVGRLAGGVAHDFNNMLGVIIGYSEMLLQQHRDDENFSAKLQRILSAAERSRDITRQLLGFASKQTISPRRLDLNEAVEGTLSMLRRLIGEDIELVWEPGNDVWPVHMDPSQIDQILTNLCINARDAISGTGQVIIKTGNHVQNAGEHSHPETEPGDYVRLSVSDNGSGMDVETRERLFEPFFTTKSIGKGTGLGLATVYGIVKQNGGFIEVDSTPGEGSTFHVCLPRCMDEEAETQSDDTPVVRDSHGETILIVEDEPELLELADEILRHAGYTVLAASTPGEAMKLAREEDWDIDLLITDVVMPEMNGRELAAEFHSRCPFMKVIFMSGYTADIIEDRGVLSDHVHFLQKPFTMRELAGKVSSVLDE